MNDMRDPKAGCHVGRHLRGRGCVGEIDLDCMQVLVRPGGALQGKRNYLIALRDHAAANLGADAG
jgi:hypothetical protein